LTEHGVADPDDPHYLCLTVWGMGDINSADVAQRVHEQVLAGVHGAHNRVRYREPLPEGRFLSGVYLDDLLLIHKQLRNEAPDPSAIQAARDEYKKFGLTRATDKSFTGERSFMAWGAHVDGWRGLIGCPVA